MKTLREMYLTDIIKIWEELHVKDTGEIGFCNLEEAIDKICGVRNDIDASIQKTNDKPDYPDRPMNTYTTAYFKSGYEAAAKNCTKNIRAAWKEYQQFIKDNPELIKGQEEVLNNSLPWKAIKADLKEADKK